MTLARPVHMALVGLLVPTVPLMAQSGVHVEVLGSFSSDRTWKGKGEALAQDLECVLYRQGGRVFGLLYCRRGRDENPPRGRLFDVEYNPANGALSFKAKLTLGEEPDPTSATGKVRPTKDLFVFEGHLTTKRLHGTLLRRDGYHLENSGRTATTTLCLNPVETNLLRVSPPESYDEWTQEKLFQGPKW